MRKKFQIVCSFVLIAQLAGQYASGVFHRSSGLTILDNQYSTKYLIKKVKVGPDTNYFKSCLQLCTSYSNCTIAVHDTNKQTCRIYTSNALNCLFNRTKNDIFIYERNSTTTIENPFCGPAFIYDNLSRVMFFFDITLTGTWSYALSYCNNLGLTLAILDTVDKFKFVSNLTNSTGVDAYINSSSKVPKVFFWPMGVPINPTFWNSGQPSNTYHSSYYDPKSPVNEGCVDLENGLLSDVPCEMNKNFICQVI